MAHTIAKNKVLELLSKTYYDVPTWMLFQVIVPLLLVGLAVLPLRLVEQIRSAYAYIFGNGAFFIFAVLLLVGVFTLIIQARSFSTKLEAGIKLSYVWGEGLTMVVAIIFVYCYAVNVSTIYDSAIVRKMELQELLVRLRRWSLYGLVGAGGAILFGLCELLATRRALLKARTQPGVRARLQI
jgi:hypothetical protein